MKDDDFLKEEANSGSYFEHSELSRPIAFYPHLAKKLGNDIEAALYFQQLSFWSDKGHRKDGFIYKTQKEIEDETCLSREKQNRVRKKLVKLKWLKVIKKKANGSPTLHYKPLVSLTAGIVKLNYDEEEQCVKSTNGNVGNPQMETCETHVSITENTTENTSESEELRSCAVPALETEKGLSKKGTKSLEQTPGVNLVFDVFYKTINKGIQFNNKTSRSAAEWLIKEHGLIRSVQLAEAACAVVGQPYAPVITTPLHLKQKLPQLQAFFEREGKQNKSAIINFD